jgi:hypothetical protein
LIILVSKLKIGLERCGLLSEWFGILPYPPPAIVKKEGFKDSPCESYLWYLSLDQVVSQLQRVVPGKWKWKPTVHDEKSFTVAFPSKTELQRAIAYGGMDVRENGVSTGIRLEFEEWQAKEEGFLLPKIWVRVTGLRKKLREFLNLWAIGSILGSTQTIYMKVTRKNNFGPILMAVLDPKLVPAQLDVVRLIGGHYFELKFEIKRIGFDESGDEVDMNLNGGDDNGNQDMEEDNRQDGGNLKRDPKRTRCDNINYDACGNTSHGTSQGKYQLMKC